MTADTAGTGAEPLLRLDRVTKRFGGLAAVDDVSLEMRRGQILGLIGPNGAGKSTIVNLVSGFTPPTAGEVLFKRRRLNGLRPNTICRLGIARTFQLVQALAGMTTLESVTVAALNRQSTVADARRRAEEVLELTGLADKASLGSNSLTFADLKRLEIAKALATEPELLIADEAMAGLRANEAEQAIELLRKLNARGITILVIEHVMRIIVSLCDHLVVVHHGRKIAEGVPHEVLRSEAVIEAYLGRGRGSARRQSA
jgi:branched-chain amino acid transport system ATP-binding protein